MKEQTIVNAIKRYLSTVPDCFFWKEHGGMYGNAGIPDIICCFNGKFLAFEVKQPGNKPTLLQQSTINQINRCGGWALKVQSVSEVKEVIEALKNDIR